MSLKSGLTDTRTYNILPSDFARQEGGFTLTALEAMASGLAVVLADGAGQIAREAASSGEGILWPRGSGNRPRRR